MSVSITKRREYRSRTKRSLCRRVKNLTICRNLKGCKNANGTKRKYCRRTRNRKY